MATIVKVIIFSLIITIIGIVAFQFIDPNVAKPNNLVSSLISENTLSVEINGEITTSGTYLIEEGSTLDDLISLAGGTTSNADELCYFNNLVLETKSTYYIAPIYDNADVCANTKITKYNINNSTSDDLLNIKNVGATIANNIISYRNEIGTFNKLEDLLKVNGIGSATFSKIKNFVRLKDE